MRMGKVKRLWMRGLTNLLAGPPCPYLARETGFGSLRKRSGFTVIELLIVVVILAIAAMTAIPMMTSAGSVQIRSAANMVAADLEYAKSVAIARGQKFSVVFDKNAGSYSIKDQAGNVIAHPVKKGSNYVIGFRDKGLDKVDIADVDFDGTSTVKFDYLGSPYNGNNNPLNRGVVELQAGGKTITITVEPVTGFISIAG
jgi:prepilin-type N-terminal cleavage/methylation domain-containing protein